MGTARGLENNQIHSKHNLVSFFSVLFDFFPISFSYQVSLSDLLLFILFLLARDQCIVAVPVSRLTDRLEAIEIPSSRPRWGCIARGKQTPGAVKERYSRKRDHTYSNEQMVRRLFR
jgi:hypothetical protein